MHGTIDVQKVLEGLQKEREERERIQGYIERKNKATERHALWWLVRCETPEERQQVKDVYADVLARYYNRMAKLVVDNKSNNW